VQQVVLRILLLAVETAPGLADEPAAATADVVVTEGRIRALLSAQRWREALTETASLVESSPDDPRIVALRGEALYRAGEFDGAGAVLERFAEEDAAPARGLLTLGRLRDAQGRQAEAIALMRRAVEAAPDDREVLYWASGAMGSRAEALALLQRYLDLSDGDDPDRVESARGSITFYEELGDTPIWLDTVRPDRLELPLEPIWDPATGRIGGYVIRVKLGSKRKPVSLLLDSGSPGLFVIERVARKRGFELVAEKTTFGGGGDRRHRTQRGFFESVAVGDLSFTSALATTSKSEMDPTGRFHGLIGLSIFNGYRVTLDFKNKRLTLEPPGDEPLEASSDYWTVMGQMLVQGEIGSAGPGLFLLDSGATRTLVAADWAERLPEAKLGAPVSIQGFGGGMRGARSLSGVDIVFQGTGTGTGAAALRAVDLSMRSRLAGVEIAGFLGLDFIGADRLIIDTVERKVSLVRSDAR
jgi:hypothetical protein